MRKIPLLLAALLLFTLLTAGGVSAFFTDRVSASAKLSVTVGADSKMSESKFSEEKAKGIVPGAFVEKDPAVVNTGKEDRFVFCEVIVPTAVAKGVASPIFSYELNNGWKRALLETKDGKQREVCYLGNEGLVSLAPGKTSTPVFNQVKFLNPAGNSDLSGQTVFVTVKMYTASQSVLKKKTKDMTPKNVFETVKKGAENSESWVDPLFIDNKFVIGKFGVNFKEEKKEEDEEKNILDREISVENTGEAKAVMFIKLTPAKEGGENEITAQGNENGLISLDRDGSSYVFGINKAIGSDEQNENIFSGIKAECPIVNSKVISIQAENLEDDKGPINTDGTLDKDTLQRIYNLAKDPEDDHFKDEDEIDNIVENTKLIEVVENFPPPAPLKVGENNFVKEVKVKNTAGYSQYVRVYMDFSDKDILNASSVSVDGGANYHPVNELKNHLLEGWSYRVIDGMGCYCYDKPLEDEETTPALFTNVRTNFAKEEDVRDFDIFVYALSQKGGWNETV